MMPSAQQVTVKQTMKPKIGFSIESIVGNRLKNSSTENYCDDSNESKSPKLTVDEYSQQLIKCAKILQTRERSLSETSDQNQSNNNNNDSDSVNKNNSDSENKKSRSPSPVKHPLIVPGYPANLIRPNAQIPPHPHHHHYPEANPHLLAQFQAAAALANVQAVQNGFPPHHHQFHNPNMQRESYPLYPWLLSRHGRIFPHRFPGNFLLQPFRKPKRVRTAFSPTQLLKLEHAFEGNHYVVGSERKTLAQQLSLTETQVKVWFQNRRTKFKRMQQEDSDSKSGNKSGGSPRNFDDDEDEDDDEMIDIGDECPTTDEEEMMMVDNGA